MAFCQRRNLEEIRHRPFLHHKTLSHFHNITVSFTRNTVFSHTPLSDFQRRLRRHFYRHFQQFNCTILEYYINACARLYEYILRSVALLKLNRTNARSARSSPKSFAAFLKLTPGAQSSHSPSFYLTPCHFYHVLSATAIAAAATAARHQTDFRGLPAAPALEP